MSTSDNESGHHLGAVLLLIADMLLLLALLACIGFVVPTFADMFRDFGAKLPAPTIVLIKFSTFIMSYHGIGFFILVIASQGLLYQAYSAFNQASSRGPLFLMLFTVLMTLILLTGSVIACMFLPIFSVSEIQAVSGT